MATTAITIPTAVFTMRVSAMRQPLNSTVESIKSAGRGQQHDEPVVVAAVPQGEEPAEATKTKAMSAPSSPAKTLATTATTTVPTTVPAARCTARTRAVVGIGLEDGDGGEGD